VKISGGLADSREAVPRANRARGVAGLAGLLGGLPLAISALSTSNAGCSAAVDFTPFPCVTVIDLDGGDAASTTFLNGDAGDGGDAGIALTPYYFAKQITADDCLAADISWIQCNAGINARYSTPTNVEAGAVTVDYYKLATGDRVAQVVFSSTTAGGQCLVGPAEFTPPDCAGSQIVCCPYAPDAGDGGMLPDAGPDSGCGF
jgi:hypothetical protein